MYNSNPKAFFPGIMRIMEDFYNVDFHSAFTWPGQELAIESRIEKLLSVSDRGR